MAACVAFGAQAQFIEFRGGAVSLEAEGNWSPFGVTSQTGARGAMSEISTLYPGAASPFGNPAALARLRGLGVQTDFFLPGMGLGVSSERTKLLRSNFREPVQNLLAEPDSHVENPSYPDIDMSLYQSSGLSGFCLAHGSPGFAFGLGVEQSLSGRIDASIGGFRMGLAAPVDSARPSGDSVKLLVAGDAFAHLTAEINDFAAGMAASPNKFLHLGLSMHRYTFDAHVDASARLDGFLQQGRQAGLYNVPGAPYSNDLNAQGYGHLQGVAHGFRLGVAWDIDRHFGVDGLLSLTSAARLTGGVDAAYHAIPALDPETFIEPAWVNPGKLALTERHALHLSDFNLVLPWEAGVSLRFQTAMLRLNVDYLYYLRGLSLGFTVLDSAAVFDEKTNDIPRGADGKDSMDVASAQESFHLNLKHHISLGLEFDQVFLHLGALFYDVSDRSVVGESAAYQPDFLPFLPTANLGYYFPLGPRFTATVSLAALPVSLFKTTVEYRY